MIKKNTKDVFVEALMNLASKKAINKISVKDIVKESGYSLQSFYNHFIDKDELVLYVHRSYGDSLLANLESGGYSFHDLIADNIRFVALHRDYVVNIIKNARGQNGLVLNGKGVENTYGKLKKHIIKKNNLQSLPISVDYVLKVYSCTVEKAVTVWLLHYNDKISEMEMTEHIENFIPEELKPYIV